MYKPFGKFISMSTLRLAVGFQILVSGATGCSGPEPYSTVQAGRDRAAFLHQHGTELSPHQRRLIRQLPYSARGDQGAQMRGILTGAGEIRGRSGRHSVLGFQAEDLRGKRGVRIIDLSPEEPDPAKSTEGDDSAKDDGEAPQGRG